MQLAALGVTLAIAIVGGTITGFILKGYYKIFETKFFRKKQITDFLKSNFRYYTYL